VALLKVRRAPARLRLAKISRKPSPNRFSIAVTSVLFLDQELLITLLKVVVVVVVVVVVGQCSALQCSEACQRLLFPSHSTY